MLMMKSARIMAILAAQQPHWWGTLADWGDIGSFLGGVAALVLAAAAIIGGSAGLGDWRAKQRAQKELAQEEAQSIRLDRQRVLQGWTPHGVEVYGVELVTTSAEMTNAQEQLTGGGPCDYAILRVNESPYDNANRARSLRQLIETEGYIGRPPTPGEYEALEAGRKALVNHE